MTRGAQRERDRERNEKDKPGVKRTGTGKAGVNADAEALQKKVAEKQRLIEAGELVPKAKPKDKPKMLTNPHTGKADPEWTKKMSIKQ